MGKRFAPGLANLYLRKFDQAAQHDFRINPLLFFRFLDDIFFIWPGDEESLLEYGKFINNLIPDIKVTLEYNMNEINFLDTTIYKLNNTLQKKVWVRVRVRVKTHIH